MAFAELTGGEWRLASGEEPRSRASFPDGAGQLKAWSLIGEIRVQLVERDRR
jgi:hypothetical protein